MFPSIITDTEKPNQGFDSKAAQNPGKRKNLWSWGATILIESALAPSSPTLPPDPTILFSNLFSNPKTRLTNFKAGDDTPRTEIMELEAVRLNSISDRYADLARIV